MDKEDLGIIIVILLIVAIIGCLIFWAESYNNRFYAKYDAWTFQCRKDGGTVTKWTSNDDECIKNGQIIDHVN